MVQILVRVLVYSGLLYLIWYVDDPRLVVFALALLMAGLEFQGFVLTRLALTMTELDESASAQKRILNGIIHKIGYQLPEDSNDE